MHSFCELAHVDIGLNSVDISLNDFDMEKIEIELKTRDKVLNPVQIKYLFLSKNSLSIYKKIFSLLTLHKKYRLI